MGRGRAKAKQTKVARKLKYHTPNTDIRALERELGGGRQDEVDIEPPEKEPDPYAAYADDRYDGDEDELREDDWLPPKKQLAGRFPASRPGGPSRPLPQSPYPVSAGVFGDPCVRPEGPLPHERVPRRWSKGFGYRHRAFGVHAFGLHSH